MTAQPLRHIKTMGLTALLFAAYLPIVHAIPPGQRDVELRSVNTTQPAVVVPSTSVTVNNDVARACIIQFSATALGTLDDFVVAGFTIDSITPQRCRFTVNGPSILNDGAATAVWPVTIGAGLHTVRVCFGSTGFGSEPVTLFERSLTVECRTQ